MKKLIIFILALTVAAASFACSGGERTEESSAETSIEDSSAAGSDIEESSEETSIEESSQETSAEESSEEPSLEESSEEPSIEESSEEPSFEGSSEEPSVEESSEEPSVEESSEEPGVEESSEEPSAEESSEEPSAEESSEEPSAEESSEEPSVEESSEEPSAEESSEEPADTDKPVITLAPFTGTLYVSRGGSIDFMSGVSGYDPTEGDLTGHVTVSAEGYDENTPGEYTAVYRLADSAGNEADEVMRTIIVKESAVLAEYPVWEGQISGEKPKPADPKVFGGAWYRKVISSKDSWTGIEATVTLPEVVIRRYDGEYDETLPYDPEVKNLDNPSVYLGGNAGSESDVGLGFSRTLYKAGTSNLTKSSFAFRPFWRYITSTDKDAGGYDVHGGLYAVTANGNNCYANYHWKYTEYYYLPGDTLRIVVYSPAPGKLQLMIEVISKSTLPSSVAIREQYGWKDPADFVSPVFASAGHGTNGVLAEFKRVNAIDQSGNEGKTAIPTDTEITGAVWHSTYLHRVINGVAYRVPMNENRRGEVNAPYDSAFTVVSTPEERAIGAETVTIAPGN
jgi:hypothetical protein